MTAARGLIRRVPALAHGEFRRVWLGGTISNSGSMMYIAALGWITTDVTDSAAAIAAVPFIGLVPLFLVSPFAGVWADRFKRKRLLLLAIVGQAAVGTAVAVMVTSDAVTYPRLIAASVIGGVFGSLGAPVFQALIPTLVPVSALRSAVILNSLQFNISRAVGPTAAGLLIDSVGAPFVFWLNAATYAALVLALWSIEDRPAAFDGARDRSVFGDIAAGARYAVRNPPIRVALTAGTVIAILVFPISYVAPILATQGLDLDASEFGILVGLFGSGAIAGGILMLLERDRLMEPAVSIGASGCAVGLLLVGVAPGLGVALVGMFVTGIAFVNVTSNVLTSLQTNLDDRVRGRVMSLWMMIYGSLGPVGIITYGSLAEAIDIQTVFVLAAAAMLTFLAVMTVRRGFRVLDAPTEATAR
ncbi:MAG: MFS transporter [Actinomycetota bacterium]